MSYIKSITKNVIRTDFYLPQFCTVKTNNNITFSEKLFCYVLTAYFRLINDVALLSVIKITFYE